MKRKIDISSVLKNVLAYTIILLVFIVEGCFNFVELEFHIEYFSQIEFWASIFFRVALLVAVRSAAMLIFLDIARAKNIDLLEAKNLNKKYMKLKGEDFPKYIDTVENPEIKARAWREQVNRTLAKLEKKAKPEDRILYFKKDDDYNLQKEDNDYCKQRKLLEEQLSDAYIKENIDSLVVRKKYPIISAAVFSLPVGVSDLNKQYQITAKTKSAVIGSIAVSAMLALISQTIVKALGSNPTDVYMLGVFISIITDLIFIIVQFWSGIMGAFSKIQSEEVTPYVNRNEILERYLYWKSPEDADTFAKWIAQLKEASKIENKAKPEA